VENGSAAHGRSARAILDDFRLAGNGRTEYVLKNLYVYFWRWGTWKVWESATADPDGDAGLVCFISTSGYLRGPGFKGMREYLRRHASEGWIIDLTPEGQTPDVPTRIFPGVRQPLAIGLFLRRPDTDPGTPATIHYRTVWGRQEDKFAALGRIGLDDEGWRATRTAWTAPLTPTAETPWDDYPATSDLFPWLSPGITPGRTWVYGPSPRVLEVRWSMLQAEPDYARRIELLKETHDRPLAKAPMPLPGMEDEKRLKPLEGDRGPLLEPVRVGYRAFDRHWVIPDSRVLDRPRPDLWAARLPNQVFVIELHSSPVRQGPGLLFSPLIPDKHHFRGSEGGRTLPFLHPDGSPNLAPGLVRALSASPGHDATAPDVLAYVAGVVAHPAFTLTFADELTTPGIRVPLTADPALWTEAVALGKQVVWLHTYGETFTGPDRAHGSIRYPHGDARQPLSLTPITTMPETMTYDPVRAVVALGDGEFGPVTPEVWDYAVGGKNVLKSWFNYRKKVPGGKKTSPLDYLHVDVWDPDWTTEFIDLLTVLTRLVELEPAQADVLERILAARLLTMDALRTAGVRWPTTPADRRPHRGFELASQGPDQLDL